MNPDQLYRDLSAWTWFEDSECDAQGVAGILSNYNIHPERIKHVCSLVRRGEATPQRVVELVS